MNFCQKNQKTRCLFRTETYLIKFLLIKKTKEFVQVNQPVNQARREIFILQVVPFAASLLCEKKREYSRKASPTSRIRSFHSTNSSLCGFSSLREKKRVLTQNPPTKQDTKFSFYNQFPLRLLFFARKKDNMIIRNHASSTALLFKTADNR